MAERAWMWYMQDGAQAHFSLTVRDVLSNTCYDWWTCGGGPLHGLHARQICILWSLTSGNFWNPCICSSCWQQRHFTIALWMCVGLSATTPASLNGCCGPWWDMSRRALNLMEGILSIYYKCTLSAMDHKLNVSGHVFIWIFLYMFGCMELVHQLCPLSICKICIWPTLQIFYVLPILDSCIFFYYLFLLSWGGVELSPFGTSTTNWPNLPAPDDSWWWLWSNWLAGETEVLGENLP
jgi:hypothetical protein